MNDGNQPYWETSEHSYLAGQIARLTRKQSLKQKQTHPYTQEFVITQSVITPLVIMLYFLTFILQLISLFYGGRQGGAIFPLHKMRVTYCFTVDFLNFCLSWGFVLCCNILSIFQRKSAFYIYFRGCCTKFQLLLLFFKPIQGIESVFGGQYSLKCNLFVCIVCHFYSSLSNTSPSDERFTNKVQAPVAVLSFFCFLIMVRFTNKVQAPVAELT